MDMQVPCFRAIEVGHPGLLRGDEVLTHVLPAVRLPGAEAVRLPGAEARRATALEAFGASHIQPSHRRMPHVLWTDSMTLIWNLLIGGRMGRYTGSPDTLVLDQRVEVRGFSAGSFAGLCTLQLTVEDPKCGYEWQAWGNCLPAAIAVHPTCNSCPPSFSLRGGSVVCVEAWPPPT